MPVRLAVVNDYPLVVAGLRAMLEPYEDRVQVVELDFDTPAVSDVDILLVDNFGSAQPFDPDSRAGIGRRPDSKVVVFDWGVDPERVRAVLAGGADGYVAKTASAAELVDALERVHQGERVVHGALGDHEAVVSGRWPGDEHGLSARESEVLALICRGLSNQDISERAYLSVNTIKTYIRSAYRKIGVTTRSQAVVWGVANGFAPQERRVLPPQPGRN